MNVVLRVHPSASQVIPQVGAFVAGALFLILIAVALSRPAHAQEAALEFHHLSGREGMATFVWDIYQDRSGIMWFATSRGLTRYDGYSVDTYAPSGVDSSAISGAAWTMLETSDGRFLVGTAAGLDRFDPETGVFERIGLVEGQPPESLRTVVGTLLEDDDGAVWVGTREYGVFVLQDGGRGPVRHYAADPDDPTALQHPDAQIIQEDRLGNIWVGTGGGGLSRFNEAGGSFETFRREAGNPKSLAADSVYAIHEDRNGRLWIGTDGGGLCRFDPVSAGFDCLSRGSRPGSGLTDGTVQSIYEAADGRLWLGTAAGGINIFNPQTGQIDVIRHDPGNPASISQDDVHKIRMDRYGTMWFSHHSTGVSYTTPGEYRFVTQRSFEPLEGDSEIYVAWVLDEFDPQAVWYGTSYGIARRDRETGSLAFYPPHPERGAEISMANLNALNETAQIDRRGRIWTGNFQGELFAFDSAARAYERFVIDDSLKSGGLYPAFFDRMGRLWISSPRSGLVRIDTESDTIDRVAVPDGSGSTSQLTTAYSFIDNAGEIWVAGRFSSDPDELEVFRYRWATDDLVPVRGFDLSQYVKPGFRFFMSPEEPGVFWNAGIGGLLRIDATTGSVSVFTVAETGGMPADVRAMTFDQQGRIWYGGADGNFGVVDPGSRTGTQFFGDDGVEIRWYGGGQRLSEGKLRFAGIGGHVDFSPARVLQGATPPDIRITRVGAGLSRSLNEISGEEVSFSHDAGNMSFEYIGLHYADPVQNTYRYRLDGFETDWHVVGGQRTAIYAGLPPGRYTFSVQAASSQGVWSPEAATFAFQIRPPWWRTIPAYVAFFVLLAGGVVGFDRVQRRRLTRKNEEASRSRELEQARAIEKAYRELDEAHRSLKQTQGQLVQQEKMASLGQLTAGIAHEIKNPLNFINNFADLNTELLADLEQALVEGGSVSEIVGDLKANADQISKHGRRADDIVRSMMAHARGGEAPSQIADLNELVDEYVSLAFHALRTKAPEFNPRIVQRLDLSVGALRMVPQDIGRVLLNLLGNAFDAVRERSAAETEAYLPTVRVETRRTGDLVELEVSDNGNGIPADVLPHIFEPFFTTKPSGEGTGLGLSLSFDIVTQGHGGRLEARSESGEGATFRVSLPVPEAHVSAPGDET